MTLRREYRSRDDTEVAVLEALVDRQDEGMTVFELRSRVGADIDELETALASLKEDGLISAEEVGERTLITVDSGVVTEETPENSRGFIEVLREKLGF
ncbi:MAG: DUF6432 family protein [Halodesulfurarchaeum sp.]